MTPYGLLHMVHHIVSHVMHLTTSTPSRSSPSSFARSSVYCSVFFNSLAEIRTSTAYMSDNNFFFFFNSLAEMRTSTANVSDNVFLLFLSSDAEIHTSTNCIQNNIQHLSSSPELQCYVTTISYDYKADGAKYTASTEPRAGSYSGLFICGAAVCILCYTM